MRNSELNQSVPHPDPLPKGEGTAVDRPLSKSGHQVSDSTLEVARSRAESRPYQAFSLIELLMVIAVIALIAGITLGVMPGVMRKKTMARVQAELAPLQAAIEYYKEKHGFYPPDSSNLVTRPPLFYELVGTRVERRTGGAIYHPLNNESAISSLQIPGAFPGINGFFNSSEDASEVKNFYPTLRPSQYARDPSNTNALVLVVPAKGPDTNTTLNTWRYVVAKPAGGPSPTHNPDSYDLWAEVLYGGRTNIIGNWKN